MQRDHADILDDRRARRFHATPARIIQRGARAAYVGPGFDLAPHRNAVAVVAVGLEAPFDLALIEPNEATPAYVGRRTALIPPGQLHHLRTRGRMAFFYLDALGDDHAAVQQTDLNDCFGALSGIDAEMKDLDELYARIGLRRSARIDPRIVSLLRAVDARPEEFPRLAIAATAAGLSPSRCRALIREAVGMPFTRYRLWRRMGRVGRELAAERSLTEAAHAAGFASSAHLSTAFKRMFGLAPSTLIRAGVLFDVA